MIKRLSPDDILSALDLIWKVFLEFEAPDYSDEGIKTFRYYISNTQYMKTLTMYGEFINNELAGIIAMRDDSHICMFFVDGKYHRKGIGKKLMKTATVNSKAMKITVNSSPYAVEVYHKLGFKNLSEEQTKDGIRFTPMVWERDCDFTDITNETETQRLGRLYPIILENHNPKWKTWYEKEKNFLLNIFGDAVLRINHIGSTAVPGLIAKPTVDILLEIKKSTDLRGITTILTENGYIVNRPQNDLIMFIKGYGENGFEEQVYHIHVRSLGDCSELYFRDYLNEHPETAEEYGELKCMLKDKYEHNRDAYTAAKGDFIGRITALVRKKYGNRYI